MLLPVTVNADELIFEGRKYSYTADKNNDEDACEGNKYHIKVIDGDNDDDNNIVTRYITYLKPCRNNGELSTGVKSKKIKIYGFKSQGEYGEDDIVIFCGSDYGHHTTAYFFNPYKSGDFFRKNRF
ncbi:MAG: hypothetical protein Q4A74_09030 [Cardiobacteriaceae bacterium]|nr:hypothetical protein [Cardiobacteriaceae bacterium]